MPITTSDVDRLTAAAVFDVWLEKFAAIVEQRQTELLVGLFDAGGFWKDCLSFTWEHRTFSGIDEIRNAFDATADLVGVKNIRIAAGRTAPSFVRRSGSDVIEAWFDFDTKFGAGAGFVRLLRNAEDPFRPTILLLLTTLHALKGFEEKTDEKRPSGEKFSKIHSLENWSQLREKERSFADRDPQVLIVGAGQGGLILAARLRQMGVDTLVIDKMARVGDVWRNRYNNLTLHNEVNANHFPYMPFPSTWPLWLPKDMLASWLENYAESLELNVWTATLLVKSAYDAHAGEWIVELRRADGSERTIRCKHLVAAMGVSGGVAKRPKLPGLPEFSGKVVHSSEFKTGSEWSGKRTLVIGTGNSGHDIAQDLHVAGARTVTIMQRGETCVVSLDPSAKISYTIYREGRPVDDVDLMVAAIPYPMLIESYKFITRRTSELDRELLEGLKEAGFRTYLGEDETGFQLLYLRGAGGYYIDVGCSQMIIERKIAVVQAEDTDGFVAEGLRMKDGTVLPLDLVVMATGFETMQEGIRRLLGHEVADRVGPVWGFDERNNLRNMWSRTAQDGFWIMGGAIIEARLFSRFLALEIKASLEGLLPERDRMPLATQATSEPSAA